MNYCNFYKMHTEPFPLVPKGAKFFESLSHLKAIELILSAIESKDIFVLVLGDYGAGKTSLCLKLVNIFKEQNIDNIKKVIYVPTPNISQTVLLKTIVKSITKKDISNCSKEVLQEVLYEYYEAHPEDSKTIVILLDDVQDYTSSAINEVKWMGDFHTTKGFFPFLFVLFAHSSFIKRISTDSFGSLVQKIKKKYVIGPFDLTETKEYIYFRLLNAGAKGFPYFSDETIFHIHKMSLGIPRRINIICSECLAKGMEVGKKIIDMSILQQVVPSLELSLNKQEEKMGEEYEYENLELKTQKETKEQVIENNQSKAADFPSYLNVKFEKETAVEEEETDDPFSLLKKNEQFSKKVVKRGWRDWLERSSFVFKWLMYLVLGFVLIGGAILVGGQLKEKFLTHKVAPTNIPTKKTPDSTIRRKIF
ncbi:MAG: AAA family ATPase [Desulfonauticus sp.]|nr:AAA family ATPase [Desulfonauticus sp.]